jgi:lipopolysaccharide biosynthesis regulator YciM
MGAALVLLLVGLGALAAGVLIGRYYVPDDRQLRRTARHSRAYMRALSHLVARDYETAVSELRTVVEENVDDVEPYFALGAMFRSRGEHERAIRVHQALALREHNKRKLRQRAMYELGLDFRAAGMPRRATRAMEEVMLEEPDHEGALRVLAALYEEQARFNEAAGLWQRLGRRRGEDTSHREHHLLVAAAQAALGRGDADSAKQLLKAAQKHEESSHFLAAAAELAAARGNHRGAKDRLKQAMIAEPALVPHLLPALIAAEHGIAVEEGSEEPLHRADDLDDEAEPRLAAGQLAAGPTATLAAGSQLALPAVSPVDAPAVGAEVSSRNGGMTVARQDATGAVVAVTAQEAPATKVEEGQVAATHGVATPVVATPVVATPVVATHGVATPVVAAPVVAAPVAMQGVAAQGVGQGAAGSTGAEVALFAHELMAAMRPASEPADGVALVAAHKAGATVTERVLAVLAEVEASRGPRLELALIRAQLVPANDVAAQAALARELVTRFPEALAARVATARLAMASGDAAAIRSALDGLVSEEGALAWALRGRWQCAHCGSRPGAFSWRCGQCRRWNTLRMETGIEAPPLPPRERRAVARVARPEVLLGAARDEALPTATLDVGLSDADLASAGVRRSLLGKVGGWVSGVWRRGTS